jgi:hypothetical protein
MKDYKYTFGGCSSVQIGGVVRRSTDKIIFDVSKPAWAKYKEEIEAAFHAGYLVMTKESKVQYEKDLKEPKKEPEKSDNKAKTKK